MTVEMSTPSILDVPIEVNGENGLLTPPDDARLHYLAPPPGDLCSRLDEENGSRWAVRSGASISSLAVSDGPPDLSDPIYIDPLAEDEPTEDFSGYASGHSSDGSSPASCLDPDWNDPMYHSIRSRNLDSQRMSLSGSDDWEGPGSILVSPSYSNVSSENTSETGKKTFTTAVEVLSVDSDDIPP